MHFLHSYSTGDGLVSKRLLHLMLTPLQFEGRIQEYLACCGEESSADTWLPAVECTKAQAEVLATFCYQKVWAGFFAWLMKSGVEVQLLASYTFGTDFPSKETQGARDLINRTTPDFTLAANPNSCDLGLSELLAHN